MKIVYEKGDTVLVENDLCPNCNSGEFWGGPPKIECILCGSRWVFKTRTLWEYVDKRYNGK